VERPTVVIELADDGQLAREISGGGVFVSGCELPLNSECTLLVRGPVEEIELAARVVYLDLTTGAGLELVGFSPALRDHLTRLLTAWVELEEAVADEPVDVEPEQTGEPVDEPDEPVSEEPPALTDEENADPVKRTRALNLHERLRGLTIAQQIKIAQTGDQQERIVLERYYNKAVWEPLLRNPRLTPPEVSRIARMGTLPRVMLEIIVNNGGWLQIPEIRRALLANPRLGTDQILRVLRMLPKHELKLASMQTAYSYAVRDAAKRLIKEAGGG